ncbi:hypothetical protein FOZ63_033456, partial [Perkinsus olseni]
MRKCGLDTPVCPVPSLAMPAQILKDIPLTAGDWISATHDKTDTEIRGTMLVQKHPVARYIATKPASQLGEPTRFSSGELLRNSKHLDPSSLLSEKRMVVEHSMQACPAGISSGTQTLRFGPVNACSQYEAQGSGPTTKAHSVGAGNSKASLRDFLERPEISFAIEALQQNETIDVFARDFDKLGVDDTRMAMLDASLGAGTEAGITECRNFHDVACTRAARRMIDNKFLYDANRQRWHSMFVATNSSHVLSRSEGRRSWIKYAAVDDTVKFDYSLS